MSESGRRRAYTWPYTRRKDFEPALRRVAAAWFAEHGRAVNSRYPYVLAEWEHWPANIILPEVVDYITKERSRREALRQGFPLHKYIHHGLSSQAMLFNLIGSLIVRNDLEPLRDALTSQGVTWPDGKVIADFEHENRDVFHEDNAQPTSIDLILRDGEGRPRLFVEAKWVEHKFGGCSLFSAGDCDGRNPAADFSACYLHHIGRRYWTLMDQHGFLSGHVLTDATCILANHYQFFREVLFALHLGGAFLLLYDSRNPTFRCDGPAGPRGLMPLLLGLIPESSRSLVHQISIQSVVQAIRNSGRHPWVEDFAKKYGLG